MDDLISRVTITAVPDEDKQAQKEALLEDGEESDYTPNTYIVAFEATNSEGEEFARQVLDEILDLYFADYSENYVNVGGVSNPLTGIYEENYDYIEMLELIDGNITSTVADLYDRETNDPYYRATSTGMSFSDLAESFSYLQEVTVSSLYSTIFEYQVTKDKSLLVSDYETRIDENDIESLGDQEVVEDVLELIDAYVTKMRDSGNTNITYEYILEDVYDRDLTDAEGNVVISGDQTVTYDKLIYNWRDFTESQRHAVIDSAYCQYIISVFSDCTGLCTAGEDGTTACASSDLTCTELNDPDYAAVEAQVEENIEALVSELNELYQLASDTNDEYNEYQGANYISTLSTSSVQESTNVGLYTTIAAIFLLVVCCCGAVLLGRLEDIVRYMFYTDHMTGLGNRMSLDNYLKDRDRKVLDDGTVCATLAITNQADINREYGRDAGDELIRLFANTLKDVFAKTGATLIYNGNARFVVMAERTDYVTVEYTLHRFRLLIDRRDILRDGTIAYEMGIAETYRDNVHRIRGLLSKATAAQIEYTSEPVQEDITA